jgi:hypothetical protein
MSEKELAHVYNEMRKMALSELYNLREIAVAKNKLNFLKLVDYVIEKRVKDKNNQMVV